MSIRQQQLSREPSDYRPADHFIHRKKERNIPGGAIRACIEDGEVRDAKDGKLRLTAIHNDEQFTMVLDPEDQQVVTMYRERSHFDVAKDRKWEP